MKSRILYLFVIAIGLTWMACKNTTNKELEDTTSQMNKAYTEKHRPQFHFSPPANWMNDPNGMVYYEGEYHLFYQYYPDSTVWGPMHWGHAVSKDMVQWEHLPIALYPDKLGYIFSGSAVVDHKNTTGFGNNGQPPLIAIFTHHEPIGAKSDSKTFQYQSIAYSTDRGRSWTKYEGNPVVPNPGIKDFRDPKVSWHEPSNQWVMVFAAWDQVKFYGSPDLKSWTHLSDFGKTFGSHGGVWECPDLFPLQVAGTSETKYVLLLSINPGSPNGGSGTQYFVGDFDGQQFILDSDFRKQVQNEQGVWVDYGRDNYAGVTWSDIPESDGRRLFLGWMSNWDYAQVVPTEIWRSAMTLPRVLTLKKTDLGYQLFTTFAKEVNHLHENKGILLKRQAIKETFNITDQITSRSKLLELSLNLNITDLNQGKVGIELSNAKNEKFRIGYDAATNQFFSDRTQAGDHGFSEKFAKSIHTAPRLSDSNLLSLHFFLDVASVEMIADNGASVMTDLFFPSEPFDQVQLFSANGKVWLEGGMVYSLKGIW